MRKTSICAAAMMVATAAAGLAAQDAPAAAKPPEKTEFTIAPFLLAAGMQGQTTFGNLPAANVDLSASEVFSHLEGGAMLYFQAKKGDWAFATDVIYMHLGQDVHPDSGFVSGAISYKQYAWEGFALYQFVPKLEVGLGFLGNNVQANMSATLTVGAGDSTVSRERNKSWAMPVLAMRWTPWKTEKWTGLVFADYGGTSGSNWSWQVMPSVGYNFSKLFTLSVQYRWIGLTYASGSGADTFNYDMTIEGPQMGFAFHF